MPNYKPVILLGNGIRNHRGMLEWATSRNIPVLLTWMVADLLPEDSPVFCGRPGIFGQRAANIIQQKATHLFCFGARLDGEQVAYDYDRFAPNAEIYVYDIDPKESKFPERYHFASELWQFPRPAPASVDWLAWCKALYCEFRGELEPAGDSSKYVDPFELMWFLHEDSRPSDIFAIGSSGNAPTVFYQAYKVKQGQRITNVCTIGSRGADIPMGLGAALANPGKRIICVTGDGGFQMNMQELEVMRRLQLPVYFFVLNNNGCNSIRVAQKARFGRVTGADPSSGLTLPNLENMADGYRIMYQPLRGRTLPDFGRCLVAAPMIVEVFVDPEWQTCHDVHQSTVPAVNATEPYRRECDSCHTRPLGK